LAQRSLQLCARNEPEFPFNNLATQDDARRGLFLVVLCGVLQVAERLFGGDRLGWICEAQQHPVMKVEIALDHRRFLCADNFRCGSNPDAIPE
jgi:hypothetical protein